MWIHWLRELENQMNRKIRKIIEIIIATNPSLEGEATALHLSKVIKQSNPSHQDHSHRFAAFPWAEIWNTPTR